MVQGSGCRVEGLEIGVGVGVEVGACGGGQDGEAGRGAASVDSDAVQGHNRLVAAGQSCRVGCPVRPVAIVCDRRLHVLPLIQVLAVDHRSIPG